MTKSATAIHPLALKMPVLFLPGHSHIWPITPVGGYIAEPGRLETVSFRGPKKESGRSKARQSVRSQNFEFLALDFDALRQSQRVFDVDAKISNRILNLGVTEQNLHGTQIPSGLVNDRRLRSA